MDKKRPQRIERVTFTRHGTPIVHWNDGVSRRPGETTVEALMRMSRDPIREMERDEAVRTEIVKRTNGERALAKVNALRRSGSDAAEDAQRAKIEALGRAGKSLTQIARVLGWKTASGKPAKTKVHAALKRWKMK